MFIPFGELAPDQAVLGLEGSRLVNGAVPLTERSYGPFNELSSITGALTARCQGAISVRSSDGTVHVFAGDATKLYKLNGDGVTWDDVSRASGYTTGADQRWYFVQMGDRIIATNYADEIQTYVIGTSALFANLSATAPKARFLAVVKGFLVAADTWDSSDGYKQNRVWWADHDDPTNWPTPGTAAAAAAQSDFQDIQFGGGINGIVGGCGGRDGVIFLQSAIVTMDYVGGGVVFAFSDAERNRGTTTPGSIINVGIFAGYIGEEGFNLFDGARSIPIGLNKVDRFIFDGDAALFSGGVDQTSLHRICVAADHKRKLIFWGLPANGGTGDPLVMLVYNWGIGRWGLVGDSTEFFFTGYTPGYTLEGLDAISTNIDTGIPYSLDSSAWMGGRPLLAGFDLSHKFGYFNGDTITATFYTGEKTARGKRFFVRGARPIYDGPEASVGIGAYYRDTQNASLSGNPGAGKVAPGANGVCPLRVSARYVRFLMQIDATTSWTHAQGVEADMIEEGTR
jgi:hypothetical protein